MHPIIYDVAVSIDGYISGPQGDISGFAHEGPVVDDYLARLNGYATAIMGRGTYEFGYRFGMAPGDNPYPHMRSIVCSRSLDLPDDAAVELLRDLTAERLRHLQDTAHGPVYFVGGGEFASFLLEERLIDHIVMKRAPILLGGGTPLFARVPGGVTLQCTETHDYADGYLLQRYDVEYDDAG